MSTVKFDDAAKYAPEVQGIVEEFVNNIVTLEETHGMPVIVFQDGANESYYIKCSLKSSVAARLCDLNAKLGTDNPESFRANRELLLNNSTYLKMSQDAALGREFNDIIVEYNKSYESDRPLKVWGGQHRTKAISSSVDRMDRYHGFRIYFNLTKDQRTDVALVSNTNISVSNETFDRLMEETKFGNKLRKWCQIIGLLNNNEDFPDTTSKFERITVKRARSFIVNFYLGKDRGSQLDTELFDQHVYEPHLAATGVIIDPAYEIALKANNILFDESLIEAGKRFTALHNAQYRAVSNSKGLVRNSKAFRNKAFVESVICGWSYIAGLLQNDRERLENHYKIPRTNNKIPDPLNAEEMSQFKHESDPPTYRGLGARSSLKDRQRMAQLFLAKSMEDNVLIDKKLMNSAVSTVVGLLSLKRGYKQP